MPVTAVSVWAGTQLGLLLGAIQKPRGLSEADILDGNEPVHLSEDCHTPLSQMLCNV